MVQLSRAATFRRSLPIKRALTLAYILKRSDFLGQTLLQWESTASKIISEHTGEYTSYSSSNITGIIKVIVSYGASDSTGVPFLQIMVRKVRYMRVLT